MNKEQVASEIKTVENNLATLRKQLEQADSNVLSNLKVGQIWEVHGKWTPEEVNQLLVCAVSHLGDIKYALYCISTPSYSDWRGKCWGGIYCSSLSELADLINKNYGSWIYSLKD